MLKVTNTLTGKKEVFTPLDKNSVKMYVCGITPYDFAHIGHGRVAVVFDLVYRLFKYLDCSITYCRNFTDIDDKLLLKAEKELGDQNKYLSVATKYIESYTDDVKKLQCLDPDYEPRVTENIQDIISFISHLIDNEKADEIGDKEVDVVMDNCGFVTRVRQTACRSRIDVADKHGSGFCPVRTPEFLTMNPIVC